MQQFADAFFNGLANGVFRIQTRFLFQVADFDARLRTRFALEIGIDAGHDAQHGGFTGAVQTQQADFGAREKTERNVFDDFAFWRHGLADADHGVDILHRGSGSIC